MTYVPVDVIEVSAWDRQVGAVALDPSSRVLRLRILAGMGQLPRRPRADHHAGPRPSPHVFPTLPVDTYHRLPALLADALPDAFGNALVEKELTSQGVRPSDISALDRLAYLGKRGIGALEFRPTRGTSADQVHRH